MKHTRTSVVSFVGIFALFASACADSSGAPNPGTGGAAATGGSTAAGGGAGKAGGAGGSQSGSAGSAGANGGSSNSGGSAGTGSAGSAGSGGTMQPPNGTGDTPNLQVMDWNGHAAAATFTFDDGDPSHYDFAGPALNERGIKATFFIVQNTIETMGQGARDGFAGLRDAGHELANHTRSHAGSSAGDASEVTDCDAYLSDQFGVESSTFAYPNVDVTSTYMDVAETLYVASRGGGDGSHITLDFGGDWHNLPSYFIADPANDQGYLNHPDQLTAAFDVTLTANAWRIVTIHGVGANGFWANTSVANLELVLDHLDGKDFWVDTFAHVAGYLRGQQALEGAAPVESGASITWTWTLPPGFPADVRLRVLIDGGTLTQGGAPVVWNGSYYPVDPKALSLTWTP